MTAFAAAFLDRDGTLMRDTGYPGSPAEIEVLPGATEAVRRLNRLAIPVILVTNQSGIGRGRLSEADFAAVQAELAVRLAAAGARLDAVYHCPHDPGRARCDCRKPAGGLFERAARELGIALADALYVGDRPRDLMYGLGKGGTAVLIGDSASPPPAGAARARDLAEAVELALSGRGRRP